MASIIAKPAEKDTYSQAAKKAMPAIAAVNVIQRMSIIAGYASVFCPHILVSLLPVRQVPKTITLHVEQVYQRAKHAYRTDLCLYNFLGLPQRVYTLHLAPCQTED